MSKSQNELTHYGILGMKWGVRRFQDKNGRLTAKGRDRYGDDGVGKSGSVPLRINNKL